MPSPFPGMNPYLEHPDVWHDFHESLFVAMREALVVQVRPHFIVQIDQHVYIHDLIQEDRTFLGRSDVQIAQRSDLAGENTAGAATLAAPTWATLEVAYDEEKVAFLEIRDREDRELVTVIELLSPTNKRLGSDRDAFLSKRNHYLAHGVHYIEIDLLRAQPRLPPEGREACDYRVMICRWELRPRVGIWPIGMRDPLPTIPIPLRGEHPDAKLDLQAVVNRVYDAAGYEDYIYQNVPQPPLSPEDAQWAEALLTSRAVRAAGN